MSTKYKYHVLLQQAYCIGIYITCQTFNVTIFRTAAKSLVYEKFFYKDSGKEEARKMSPKRNPAAGLGIDSRNHLELSCRAEPVF